jgi:hypothetical protein
MKKWGGLTLALLVGCATGAAVRDLVVPARAEGNAATYAYKIYSWEDLRYIGVNANPGMKRDPANDALSAGFSELGKRGWRYSGKLEGDSYVFEARAGQ